MSGRATNSPGILVVRLGAMGDVLHALPAVASLKHSFPETPLTWVIERQWSALLEENRSIDRVIYFDRRDWRAWKDTWRQLREQRFSMALDFQGLMKSAVIARAAGAERIFGFVGLPARERLAAWLYSDVVRSPAAHRVDNYLDLAAAAGARERLVTFPLPRGRAEGELPASGFVLASPLAGWKSKQWPLEFYADVAAALPLVLNGPPAARRMLESVRGAIVHTSSIDGLIDATRRASAVIGVDSGPMHLASALGKRGVAIFGPTDPAGTGPYSGNLQVLRSPRASTSYKRGGEIDPSMRDITPEQVISALKSRVDCHA
jgi:heptosyltransferase-1